MRQVGWAVVMAAVAALIVWRGIYTRNSDEAPFEARSAPPEPAPLCPWREPERDLKAFFPEAKGHRLEVQVLSGWRLELTQRLGRAPAPDESVLYTHRALRDGQPVGAVLTRRVKGGHGAIELVLALDTNQQPRALKIQRLREPASITTALENHDWVQTLRSLNAQNASTAFPADALTSFPPEARPAAGAIVDGVRSLLILFATAEEAHGQKKPPHKHH